VLFRRLLKEHNGTLMIGGVITAAYLCTAVFDGDMQLLKRLLVAGANVNAVDYDKRTATHIAAADGSLSMVSLF
jgi:glutaminase